MNHTSFNFEPEWVDFNAYLNAKDAWQVIGKNEMGMSSVNPSDLQQGIIDDILAVTMWEIQTEKVADFTIETIINNLNPEQAKIVLTQMKAEIVDKFVTYTNGQVRIKQDRHILQLAMDYCGTWYHGFKSTPDQPEVKFIVENICKIFDDEDNNFLEDIDKKLTVLG